MDLQAKYNQLCAQLGDIEYNLLFLQKKKEEIIREINLVNDLAKSKPKVEAPELKNEQ